MFTVRLENIKIRQDLSNDEVAKIAYTKFNIPQESVTDYKIVKKSIDARDKNDIFYNYSIVVFLKENFKVSKLLKNKNASLIEQELKQKTVLHNDLKAYNRPVIIGAGPAGLFCALTLIENGVKPIIVEQGKTVEERQKDVELFLKERILNTCSNVQFGEGGAGTFSDGKLTTNLHSPLCRDVIDTFVKFGAPEEISYINKPHIGTDNLVKIVANIRKYIENNGGEFMFGAKAVDFEIENNQVKSVIVSRIQESTTIDKIATDTVVLAIGHSSRDMFKKLYEKHVEMEKKNFSVGVRIEHKQQMINESQYGKNPKLKLPPAEYKLAYHGEDRSCYTFCMCPGGTVMASSSEEGTIVTNGMSKYARDGENANSAVLVNVTPEDLISEEIFSSIKNYMLQQADGIRICKNISSKEDSSQNSVNLTVESKNEHIDNLDKEIRKDNPLLGMYFQEMLEEKAFALGGNNYNAPIQRVEDFLNNKKTDHIGEINPTYKPGITMSNLKEILPEFVTEILKEGIVYFDRKIKGFANPDAILTGVETRSSSPVTIKRNEQYMANIKGMYPCGEGAGYAGGIMSAAIDGIRISRAILTPEQYATRGIEENCKMKQ
jgi:uncharacterized FAD-dependent dehydrogenase